MTPTSNRSGDPAPFDLVGPLPTGTTLLEASAGTGKTFTVGALVTRYVAEGAATLDEMLVITFSRAASQELRLRVREQLVERRARPRRTRRPVDADAGIELLGHLLDAGPAELAAAPARLRDALAAFDSATIATTHQFCQVVLRSLGIAGDTDATATLVEDLDELVLEVVDDLYLRPSTAEPTPAAHRARRPPPSAARRVGDPQARARARRRRPGPRPAARADFARAVPRRGRAAQAAPRHPVATTTCSAGSPTALEDDDAPARARMRQPLADRARRRVPGHRPGAVAGARRAPSTATPR